MSATTVDHDDPEFVEDSTLYPVSAEPPSDAGAVHDNPTCVSPAVPPREVGTPGVVIGLEEVVPEAVPVPTALMAETRKRYSVPLVRLVAVWEVDVDPVSATTVDHDDPEFVEDSTLYPVSEAPPLPVGAVQESSTCWSPAMPPSEVGAPGAEAPS